MFSHINKDILKSYFYYLKPKLKTGVDKVNCSNFESNLDYMLDIIINKVLSYTYKFTRLKEIDSDGRKVYIPTIRDRILLEYLKDSIRKKFKIRIPDRNRIVENIKYILSDELDYSIIKLDIEKFFKSINHELLLHKLEKSSVLNSYEFYLIKQLLEVSRSGLPEGLSISNYLSELYLENFDRKLRNIHDRILFYARYVDDILIIIPGKLCEYEVDKIKSDIDRLFVSYELHKNDNKCFYLQFYNKETSKPFDYLGYRYQRIYSKHTKQQSLSVSISEKKLIRICKKIDIIFNEFRNNRNTELFYERLQVLIYTNKIFKIKSILDKDYKKHFRKNKINYGLVENYQFADDESFQQIDKYIKRKFGTLSPFWGSRNDRRRLYSLSVTKCKKCSKLINYERIPFHVLRSKVYRFDGGLSYLEVVRMSKGELLKRYYDLVNLRI